MKWLWFWKDRPPSIALAKLGDAARLAAIHATGFERGWDAIEFERLLLDPQTVCHMARAGRGAATGFALSRLVAGEAEILTVAVLPAARGKGLARRILQIHFETLAAHGARHVVLEVASDNEAALNLYEAFGFVEIGRRPAYYARAGREPVAALLMRRDL